jgi:peptidylprolyl isomerase
VRAEAGTLEPAAEVVFLRGVAEAGEPEVWILRPKASQECPDRLRASDRHDGDSLRVEIPATARRQGLECGLVADSLDEDDGTRLGKLLLVHVAIFTADACKFRAAMALERPQIDKPDGDIPFELGIEDITVGDGAEATKGSKVSVHYVGVSFSSGEEFDASWNRGQPFEFKLGKGQVIPGWDAGVQGMKVGGRRKLTIPSAMAYGARGAGGVIEPHEPLVFVVDLLSVS